MKRRQLGDRGGVVACHGQKMEARGLNLREQLGWVGGEFAEGRLDAHLPDRCGADEHVGLFDPAASLRG
jgi:hypothetical protein